MFPANGAQFHHPYFVIADFDAFTFINETYPVGRQTNIAVSGT